jgi:hypothetical protein
MNPRALHALAGSRCSAKRSSRTARAPVRRIVGLSPKREYANLSCIGAQNLLLHRFDARMSSCPQSGTIRIGLKKDQRLHNNDSAGMMSAARNKNFREVK